MPDAPLPPEPSFAEYVRTENSREQQVANGGIEIPAPVVDSASEVSVSGSGEPDAGDPPPTPTELAIAADATDRNADGTFKQRSKKSDAGAKDVPRIHALTQKWRAEEARANQLAAELETLRRPLPATSAPASAPADMRPWDDPSDPEPTLERYLDKPDPYAALAVEAAKWAIRDVRRQDQLAELHQAEQTAMRETAERVTQFEAAHPDYRQVVTAIDDIQFSPKVFQMIAGDDDGPAVAYYLGAHPDEARRIAALQPEAGILEIGKLLMRVAAAPSGSAVAAPQTSRAKALIKPVGASPVVPDHTPPDPEKTPFADWMRLGNAADRKRRQEMRGA